MIQSTVGRLGKPLLATGLAIALLLAGFLLMPSVSADRTPVIETALPTAREGTSAVATDDGIYLFGGFDQEKLDEILHFDPATGAIRTLEATLPTPRTVTAAIWDGDHAYIFGGWSATGYLDEIVRFDPADESVQLMSATLPTPRAKLAAVWTGEHAYLLGGATDCNPCESADILRWDPQADMIERYENALPERRAAASAIWTGDEVLLMGGYASQPHKRSDEILHYDPDTQEIRTSPARLPEGRSHTSAVFIAGSVYLLGGLSCGRGTCDTILQYDAQNEALHQHTLLLQSGRQLASAATFDEHAYIFGGSGTIRFDEILRFSPTGAAPPSPAGPIIETIHSFSTRAGDPLTLEIQATHPANKPITLSADPKPATATLTDNEDGTGRLEWTPQMVDVGDQSFTIRASDGRKEATETFTIIVNPADAPIIQGIWDRSVETGTRVMINVHATDPKNRSIDLDLTPVPTGAGFIDHGDGQGLFDWSIGTDQEGRWDFTVTATADGTTSRETFTLQVKRPLVPPELDLGRVTLLFGEPAEIPVQATHRYDEAIQLIAMRLPAQAAFTDHGDGTGTISWTPKETDVGLHEIPIRAATSARETTQDLEVNVVRALDLRLETLDPIHIDMSPGETRSLSILATNTGYNELTIDSKGSFTQTKGPGWRVQSPSVFTLQQGEERIIDINVTAPTQGTYSVLRLQTTGTDDEGASTTALTHWIIEVPLHIKLEMNDRHPTLIAATTNGIQVTVSLTWADGSPARHTLVDITHRINAAPSVGPVTTDQTHQSETDSDGRYTFNLGTQNPGAMTPGDHTLTASVTRGDRTDLERIAYTIAT